MPHGEVEKVVWPFGWSGVVIEAELALVDERGRLVGLMGERVEVPGGELDAGTWLTCGEVQNRPDLSLPGRQRRVGGPHGGTVVTTMVTTSPASATNNSAAATT